MKIIIEWAGEDKQPDRLLEKAMEYAMNEGLEYGLTIAGNIGTLVVDRPVETRCKCL